MGGEVVKMPSDNVALGPTLTPGFDHSDADYDADDDYHHHHVEKDDEKDDDDNFADVVGDCDDNCGDIDGDGMA